MSFTTQGLGLFQSQIITFSEFPFTLSYYLALNTSSDQMNDLECPIMVSQSTFGVSTGKNHQNTMGDCQGTTTESLNYRALFETLQKTTGNNQC